MSKETPKQLLKELKIVSKHLKCKELLKQAYIIGKKALLLEDLDIIITLITRRNGFNSIIQNFLAKEKGRLINETIKANRKPFEPYIFYLVSKHIDCADDHLEYQGAVYVDEDYDKKDIFLKDYIDKHNVSTIQWLIDKPVYMFTRPNCRHWFVALTRNEVLTNDINYLLKKYNMIDVYDKDKHKKERVKQRVSNYNRQIELYKKLLNVYETPKIIYMINHTKNMLHNIQK